MPPRSLSLRCAVRDGRVRGFERWICCPDRRMMGMGTGVTIGRLSIEDVVVGAWMYLCIASYHIKSIYK
jgi:hypothetical protein